MFRCWRKLTPEERFGWGQKGSSLVHSSIMAAVGVSVVLRRDWRSLDLINGRDERVAAFIALELGYLLQVCPLLPYTSLFCNGAGFRV